QYLLFGIPFHKTVESFLLVFDGFNIAFTEFITVFDMANPIINNPYRTTSHSGFYTAAAIMSANDYMFHFQYINLIIKYTQHIHIRVNDHLGNVPVNKHLGGLGTDNLVCRHATV